jgi:hypothetical protein
MKKLTTLVLAGLFAVGLSGVAFAECPGHGKQMTEKPTTDQTVADGSTSKPKTGN